MIWYLEICHPGHINLQFERILKMLLSQTMLLERFLNYLGIKRVSPHFKKGKINPNSPE